MVQTAKRRETARQHSERLWIVLGTDGRHITLGRDSDPSDAEIQAVEDALTAAGGRGWLAIAEGDYWSPFTKMELLMVRPLARPTDAFEAAVAAFESARRRALN